MQVSVLPQSEADVITPANVDAALAASNLTAGEELGGEAEVANVVLAGAPDTRIIVTSRPGGRTVPITEDGSLPGVMIEEPEASNQARFRWQVWFGDTECTGCESQCKLDQGEWESCSSPKLILDIPEGEHNFRVRGLGGDGTPDPTPDRYTWTVRYHVEVFFAVVPPSNIRDAGILFNLTSNKDEAVFEYSLNLSLIHI